MRNWNTFPRYLLVLSLLIGFCAGTFAPHLSVAEAKPVVVCPDPIITQWTFSNIVTPSTGVGTFSSGTGLNPSTPPPYTFLSGTSISFSSWNTGVLDTTAYIDFQVDTTGRSSISLNFDYRSTSTGPTILEIHYSTDGTNYIYFSTLSLINDATFRSVSVDLSSITALENNLNARFRLYGYGATGATGTLAIDNTTILGNCPYTSLMILINEVAWSGTVASSDDEWIELHNPGATDIDLTGWRLVAEDGSPDITLSGSILAGGYYLLERGHSGVTDQNHDLIFFGTLADSGEILRLRAPDGTIVDTANSDGGAWPAGTVSPPRSMERMGVIADETLAWVSFADTNFTALDAAGNDIYGTPGSLNWGYGVTHTPTPTNTLTFTPSPTLTPTITLTPSNVRSVIINEVAWAGTASGLSDDEWIELYNPGNKNIDLSGWSLKSSDGTPNIVLNGIIFAKDYFLLERGSTLSDDTTVSDIPADQIYTGNALSNTGEALTLYDASNKIIDTANGNGGSWPKGSSTTYGTMERVGTSAESDSTWQTNTGVKKNGKNANGGDILGTPKSSNSPTPTPTPTLEKTLTPTRTPTLYPVTGRPFINEFLPRPGYDWNRDGRMDVFDEFIEIKNHGPVDINLKGWKLDDEDKLGSNPFTLPDVTLKPGERVAFYASQTNILLSDGGDTVRLLHPDGTIFDAYTYALAGIEDKSICRLPDADVFGSWEEDCTPTPNLINTRYGNVPVVRGGKDSPICDLPDTIPADFLFAECRGYGANVWNPFFWDQQGWQGRLYIQENLSKWKTFVE